MTAGMNKFSNTKPSTSAKLQVKKKFWPLVRLGKHPLIRTPISFYFIFRCWIYKAHTQTTRFIWFFVLVTIFVAGLNRKRDIMQRSYRMMTTLFIVCSRFAALSSYVSIWHERVCWYNVQKISDKRLSMHSSWEIEERNHALMIHSENYR